MKVGIYARYSTDQQDKISIPAQVANCEALCDRERFRIVARYTDEGISGGDDHRPEYIKMLRALENGELDAIVSDETSRVTRHTAELHRLVAELRFRDQYLITCDGVDTRSESSEILLSVKAAMDAMESRKIGNRVYRSNRERHRNGHSAGGRIYGYTSVQDGDYRKRVIEPEQAEVVRQIFAWYADGDSAKTIARKLNVAGIPSPSGKRLGWPHTTILGSKAKASGILRNSIYIGQPAWGKRINKRRPGTANKTQRRRPESDWEVVQDESLRIVDDITWKRVQKRLNKPTRRSKGGRPPSYLLSGLLVCDDCGGHYSLYNGRSYRCSSQQNGRDAFCSQTKTLFRTKLEQVLLGGIKEQLLEDGFAKAMAKRIRKLVQTPTDHTAEIRRIEKQVADLVETLISVGKSEAIASKIAELESRKTELESRQSVGTVVPDAEKVWRSIVENLENLKDYADAGEVEEARRLVGSILGKVTIRETNGKPEIVPELATGCNLGAEKRT